MLGEEKKTQISVFENVQVVGGAAVETGSPTWIRTRNPVINSREMLSGQTLTNIDNTINANDLKKQADGQKIPNNDQIGPLGGPKNGPEKELCELIQLWFYLSEDLRKSILTIAYASCNSNANNLNKPS